MKRNRRTAGIPKEQKYFHIEGDELLFPRGAIRPVVGLCAKHGVKLQVTDNRSEGVLKLLGIEFIGTLRDYQEAAVKDVLQREFGVLVLSTGGGKTITAIYLMCQHAVSTIISVPNVELAHQWLRSIKQFTNLTSVGLLGDGVVDIQPVTVAIINSLSDHSEMLADKFRYVIFDKGHRCGSEMYINGPLTLLPTKYQTGLSATFYRRDGRNDVLEWFLGSIVHEGDKDELRDKGAVLRPDVCQIPTNFFYNNPAGEYQRMISAMVEDGNRNELIANEVIQDVQYRKNGGITLVVSDRKKHLENILEIVKKHIPESWVFLLTGSTKRKERREIVEKLNGYGSFVLFSTVALISEGFDLRQIISAHLATPLTFKLRIVQIIGRVLRPESGKRPVVIDYVDSKV